MSSFDFFWGLFPWLADAHFLAVSSHDHTTVCTYPWFLCVHIFSSDKDTHQIGLGPTLRTSFQLNHLLKGPITKYSYIPRYWSFHIWILAGHSSVHSNIQKSYIILCLTQYLHWNRNKTCSISSFIEETFIKHLLYVKWHAMCWK